MSLTELSTEYRKSAELLSNRLACLRAELKQTTDPNEIFHLNRRIAALTPMLTEMNILAELTERYYERGFHRDARYSANCFRDLVAYSKEASRSFEQNHPTGADGAPAGYFYSISPSGSYDTADSGRAGCKQKHRKSHTEESRTDRKEIYPIPIEVLDTFFK